MSYFEFDDVRRIHMPYEDSMNRSKFALFLLIKMIDSEFLEASCI